MASVLFFNALQLNFSSVLTLEHSGMVKMFKSLKDSGLKEFLEASGSVYEEAVLEFFANAKVLAGTIVSLVGARNIAITKDTFIEFSGSDEPFRAPNKKREMKIEFRILHDIVAKALCAKPGSFDQVTSEKLDLMIAITAEVKVSWAQILFQVLSNMVNTPKRQLQGFSIQRSAGDGGDSQYGSIPTIPVDGEGTFEENLVTGSEEHERANRDQDAQMSNDSLYENQGGETQLDSMNPNDKESDDIQDEPERSSANSLETETNHSERAVVAYSGPRRQAQPTISYTELRLVASIRFCELDWVTHVLPKTAPKDNGKEMMEVFSRLHPVEEHCQQVIKSTWDTVSAQMIIFEEWVYFRKKMLEWGETEEVSELFERRSLILYKLFEMEVEKVYHEHLANFKLDAPSVNHDYFCIRHLHKELKVIATVHKNHRAMAGLPTVDEEVSLLESASNQPQLLEFSSLADQEQAAAQTGIQQLDQPDNENTAMISHEHPAQENEPPVQTDGHQAVGNEHHAHDEHGTVPGSDRSLKKHSAAIVLSVNNPETITTSEMNNLTIRGVQNTTLLSLVPGSNRSYNNTGSSRYWCWTWTGPTGPGPTDEHSVHLHHRDFIVTPIANQIRPIDSVSETECYDLKNHFSEPQCKMTVLPLNSGKPRTCVTLNDSGIQLAVGPQPLWLRNHNSGLAHRIMVKRLATSHHDPLGINDSACKNQLVVVSVQYGPFNPYIPIRSTTIDKSRVAIDPIAMHTSWRSNSDIASVTSIGYACLRAVNPRQRCIDSYMHRGLTQSGRLMTPSESANGSK
ncbi:hypothetical protein F511_23565 [Dorcoceras hygrometricum]|uniref:Uncharacterized protein n=1 Tax=Dorcoceras hygrometricum TaxID=472368 RepID=A0A2Z7CJS0_9LAMI|nr:hypothetical protein F511_23565 [Dorcoceras hygrometricum]